MSKIKANLLKQIEQSVARKKMLSKQISQEKTIANWVAEFFIEYEKVKRLDNATNHTFSSLALNKLTIQLRNLDRKCLVSLKEPLDQDSTIEIRWSDQFIKKSNCEEVMVFDASAALFQEAIENLTS